jgi:hypothetical protein
VRFRDLRWIGLKLLDARWIAADGMRRLEPHLQPVLNILGDFLEIFSKWYGVTVPIAADYPGRARFARCQCFGRRWRPVCAENSDSTILVAFGLQKTGGRILTHVKNSLLFFYPVGRSLKKMSSGLCQVAPSASSETAAGLHCPSKGGHDRTCRINLLCPRQLTKLLPFRVMI